MPFIFPNGQSTARYYPTKYFRRGRRLYRVLEAFGYVTEIDGVPCHVEVPAGFNTDLASIPRLPFMPSPGGSLWDDAAIVHDVAITAWPGPRRQADAIFYNALLDRGCTRFTAWVFWAAVRINSIIKRKA